MKQDYLRYQTKIAKSFNNDWFYKDFADYLEMNINSFYNWLNGKANLSRSRELKLLDLLQDLLDGLEY